ncbi:MAG TPA: signal peptide peptidase SppA [Phycisphaerales bacterium]|nr:signal peptide peptidase SppA [Phycisphaerales bacterium]
MSETPPRRWLAVALLGVCAIGATGCLPSRVVIDLAPGDGRLVETVVLADAGAGGSGPKIALIDVTGLISHTPGGGLIAGRASAVDSLVARLAKAEQDPLVRAVVLRVNSPGGTVAASETVYHEVRRFRQATSKPVVVSMAEVAASGGYYLSLAADRIVAQPTTITGSIGVILQTVNFSQGMARLGIEARAVTSGPNKDLANPLTPAREGHYGILQGQVDEFYASFRALVLERRPALSPADAQWATDGRVMTGARAHEAGLVDELGGVRDAFASARRLAGVERARLVKYHAQGAEPRSPYSTTGPTVPPSAAGGTEINMIQLNLPEGLLPTAGFYYVWTPGIEGLPGR